MTDLCIPISELVVQPISAHPPGVLLFPAYERREREAPCVAVKLAKLGPDTPHDDAILIVAGRLYGQEGERDHAVGDVLFGAEPGQGNTAPVFGYPVLGTKVGAAFCLDLAQPVDTDSGRSAAQLSGMAGVDDEGVKLFARWPSYPSSSHLGLNPLTWGPSKRQNSVRLAFPRWRLRVRREGDSNHFYSIDVEAPDRA